MVKRKPGGKDRHDLSRAHTSPQIENDGTASLMSGDCDYAHPDLRPPEPDKVPALGAVDLTILPRLKIGEAVHDRCHSRAIHDEDIGQVESAEAIDVPARARMNFATRHDWPVLLLPMRSGRSNAHACCHPWSRSPLLRDGTAGPARCTERQRRADRREARRSVAASCRASLQDSASISGWRSVVIAARSERYAQGKHSGPAPCPAGNWRVSASAAGSVPSSIA